MACRTNDYSYNNNFARGFTSASMNGGVTFFGSTVSTYPLPDRNSFLSIFGKLRTKTNYHIADLTSWGMGSYYSGLKICARRRQVEKYNLIGDPSLRIYGVSITDGNVGSYTPPYKYNTPKQEVADKYGGEATAKMITISPTIAKNIITIFKILTAGQGAEVTPASYVVSNYAGWRWGEQTVFDWSGVKIPVDAVRRDRSDRGSGLL